MLGAGTGPLGESEVVFELEPLGPGRTRITMTEFPTRGLVKLAGRVAGPVVDRLVDARNTGSLDRLRTLLT